MPECDCGAFVTARYAAVFGDDDGEVFACRSCSTIEERTDGATAAGGAPEEYARWAQ